MTRLSISIDEEQSDWIEEKVEEGDDYESKSALVRECINRYEQVDNLRAERDDLRRQLREANARNDDVDELAEYVEGEKQLQSEERERRRAPIWKRIEWLIFGRD